MPSTLVLVRHAKAQSGSDELPDQMRELTDAGRRSAASRLPKALDLLEPGQREGVQIWSSPALRAIQTAEIVADALGVEGIELHASLYQGPAYEELVRELSTQGKTIVLVGHNPQLEYLAARLTGDELELKKASCLCIVHGNDSGQPYELSWLVQGPDSRRWESIEAIEKVLAGEGDKIEARLGEFLSKPEDPETLHQYRISLRVARSVVAFLVPYLKKSQARKVEAGLRNLARATSRQRELDVMLEALIERGAKSVQDAALIVECAREQEANREDLVKFVSGKKGAALLSECIAALRAPEWNATTLAQGLCKEALGLHYDELFAACKDELASCDFADVEETHDVRKDSKRLRYIARELKAVLGDQRAEAGKQAKEVQDKLGKLCDARVNFVLANELAADGGIGDQGFSQEQSDDITRILGELNWDRTVAGDESQEQ